MRLIPCWLPLFLAVASSAPATAATCALTPGPISTTSFIWTPPEELTSMAWKLPACTACDGAAITPTAVTFRVRWPRACSAEVEVSIVAALSDAGCSTPDTSRVLCGPVTATISNAASGNAVHTVTLPAGCCVDGEAFVLVRFAGFGACGTPTVGPGLAASTATCAACEQYVTAAGIYPSSTEWCSIGAGRMTWFSVDADCCLPTGARTHSWGSLKLLYR